jgi:hypothetical protein
MYEPTHLILKVFYFVRTMYTYLCISHDSQNKPQLLSYLAISGCTALVELGRFFSSIIYTQSVGLLGREISPPQGRYLHTEQHTNTQNKRTQTSMPRVGFEPTISGFELAKTVHALDRAVNYFPTRHKPVGLCNEDTT